MDMAPEVTTTKEETSLRHRITDMQHKDVLAEVLNALTMSAQNAVLYTQFLTFISRFRKYSFYNRLMLFAQYPQGSQFASSKDWRMHNRIIRKDEKSCRIYKPRIKKKPLLDAHGRVQYDAAKKMITKDVIIGWNLVPVFAYEQTVQMNDKKVVLIPSYKGLETDDPYHVRDSIIKSIESLKGNVVIRNLEFAQDHVLDESTIIVNQLYDVSSQNLTLIRDLCRRCMKAVPQESWREKALDIAELITAMSIGTPKTQLRVIDVMQLHGDVAQLAIGAVDRAMKVLESYLVTDNG